MIQESAPPPVPASPLAVRLNVAVLVVVVLCILCIAALPFSPLATWLNEGRRLPVWYTAYTVLYFLSVVVPLVLLNVFWVGYDARRRNLRGGSAVGQGQPGSTNGRWSGGVVLLSIATVLLLNCLMLHAAYLPLGLWYTSHHFPVGPSSRFVDVFTYAAWAIMALLAAINVAWMVYGIARWRTHPLGVTTPTLPDGADDFAELSPSPHVTPAKRSE